MAKISCLVAGMQVQMDESHLEKREGAVDNDNEFTTWVEYWYDGELVHRSAHVTLKTQTFPPMGVEQGSF